MTHQPKGELVMGEYSRDLLDMARLKEMISEWEKEADEISKRVSKILDELEGEEPWTS